MDDRRSERWAVRSTSPSVVGRLETLVAAMLCGYQYAVAYHMPLNGVNAQFGSPYSTRPDAFVDQGATAGGPSGNWSCTPGAQGGCYHYDFGGDGTIESGITHFQMTDNRDAFVTWVGLFDRAMAVDF